MKLSEAQMEKVNRPGLQELYAIFTKNGYQLRLAGGPVRDLLKGEIPSDLDFATNATPTTMKEFFNKDNIRMINDRGEKHGTITPRICDNNFECTTLRLDTSTDGRHAEVEFITDWELDAGRRDLTVNAMFLDLDGTVYDYHNGIQDLEARRVRFVGDPVKRITEDYLRILRYFRFFGRLLGPSDPFEEDTIQAIKDNAVGLTKISKERLWLEFKKILELDMGGVLLLKMDECGILKFLGILDDFRLDKVKALYDRLEEGEIKQMHVSTILAHGMTKEDAEEFCLTMKTSNKERFLMMYMTEYADINPDVIDEDFLTKQFTSMKYLEKIPSQTIIFILEQLLKVHHKTELIELLVEQNMPIMPKVSNLVKERIQNKKSYKVIIDMASRLWIDSNYTKTSVELIDEIVGDKK